MSPSSKSLYRISNLKKLRQEAGLNKSELGRLAEVSARTVANAETGAGVKKETVAKIERALKTHREKIGLPQEEPKTSPAKPKKRPKKLPREQG